MVLREPYGVVGAISPWNYPLLMATWKIAPALAAGNTVVLKPAEQAPLSCLRLAELFIEAGGPPGVFNVVNGLGEEAGKALALHNDVRKITFTGSTVVGKLILQYAGQSNMKQVALECGGKTPQVFMADTEDLDRAVTAAYRGIYSNMGEVCNAGSRLLVDRSIRKKFVERFIELGQDAFKPGDPLDPDTNMGPLVTHGDQKRVLGMIEKGRKEGAKLEFGGDTPAKLKKGAYVNPTLFTGVQQRHDDRAQEIFGPVASVIEFNGVDEAITIANDTIYGLAAGHLDARSRHRVPAGARHRGRHDLDQHLRRGRHDAAVRRLQAVRQRARQVPRQLQELHAVEVGLVPASRKADAWRQSRSSARSAAARSRS